MGFVKGNAPEIASLMGEMAYQSCWSSPEKFADYIRKQENASSWYGHCDSWNKGNESFTGSESMEETLHLADGNWKKGAEKVERMRNLIKSTRPQAKTAVKYDVVGAIPSIPRAVSGNILNMKTPETGLSKKRPVITLISNMCVSCGINKDVIANRSAAIAAIVDQIEEFGYSVEVISTAISVSSCQMAATSIMAKTSDKPVDIMRLAFALGHPSMFRRMVFDDWEKSKEASFLGYGLGTAVDKEPDGRPELHEKHIYKMLNAQTCSHLFISEEETMTVGLDALVKHLNSQGCPCFKNWTYSKEFLEAEKKKDDDGLL